jgi:hypothetical protein
MFPPTQAPLRQLCPVPQTVQLVPQWPESSDALQAPSMHFMLPPGHIDEHMPLVQTLPLGQTAQLGPQCCVFDATHALLHSTSPDAQEHVPDWHTVPLLQACPHPPQFELSLWTSMQLPLHSI